MGLVIVIVVGAILGWLAAIVIEREDGRGTALCTLAGMAGAITAAAIASTFPLVVGVTAAQLLWGVAGATLAIILINVLGMNRLGDKAGSV